MSSQSLRDLFKRGSVQVEKDGRRQIVTSLLLEKGAIQGDKVIGVGLIEAEFKMIDGQDGRTPYVMGVTIESKLAQDLLDYARQPIPGTVFYITVKGDYIDSWEIMGVKGA